MENEDRLRVQTLIEDMKSRSGNMSTKDSDDDGSHTTDDNESDCGDGAAPAARSPALGADIRPTSNDNSVFTPAAKRARSTTTISNMSENEIVDEFVIEGWAFVTILAKLSSMDKCAHMRVLAV